MITNFIDSYLLKSGMPKEELCVIGRAKRAFYYYGMAFMAAVAVTLAVLGAIRIFG